MTGKRVNRTKIYIPLISLGLLKKEVLPPFSDPKNIPQKKTQIHQNRRNTLQISRYLQDVTANCGFLLGFSAGRHYFAALRRGYVEADDGCTAAPDPSGPVQRPRAAVAGGPEREEMAESPRSSQFLAGKMGKTWRKTMRKAWDLPILGKIMDPLFTFLLPFK